MGTIIDRPFSVVAEKDLTHTVYYADIAVLKVSLAVVSEVTDNISILQVLSAFLAYLDFNLCYKTLTYMMSTIPFLMNTFSALYIKYASAFTETTLQPTSLIIIVAVKMTN